MNQLTDFQMDDFTMDNFQMDDFQMDDVTMDDDTFEFLGEDGNIVSLSSIFETDLFKSFLYQNIQNEGIDETSLTLNSHEMLELLSMNQILDTLLYVNTDN